MANQLTHSSREEVLCTGPNMSALPHAPSCSSSNGQTQSDPPGSFAPTLATHFDETLIRHIQGWPSENTEKQVMFHPDSLTRTSHSSVVLVKKSP